MKKLVLSVMAVAIVLCSYAQSNSLGINAGVGRSGIKNYEGYLGATNKAFKTHGNVGLSFIHSTKTNFGFGADLKYSWEGAKVENENTKKNTELSLQYVRLPIKVMYFFGKYGQRLRPKVYAGPSFGYLAAAKQQVETNGTSAPEVNVKNSMNDFDIGIVGGAGVNYRLVKNTWFTADVNYFNSFRDIRVGSTSGKRLSGNTVALNVGVNWGIGK